MAWFFMIIRYNQNTHTMRIKKLHILFLCLFAIISLGEIQAQVGIGTENPTNTLHIKPENSNEDPLKIEDLNQLMTGDSAFLVVDPSSGVIRYMPYSEFLNYVNINVDNSNTNELQNASEVPLSPNFDIDSNGFIEENVQEAIEALANTLPKGTYKTIGDARAAGLEDGESFYADPKGVFGCSGCIITLFEGMN